MLRASSRVILIFALSVFCCCQSQTADSLSQPAQKLAAEQRWQEIVDLASGVPDRSADLQYYFGSALAHLKRWDDARTVLIAGRHSYPHDSRFPVELAGISFKQKNYSQAAAFLRRAVRLNPGDAYATDFLATVYFLQGNLEAALKYWNRLGKPQVAQVRSRPVPHLQPALLDHAFAFAPADQLTFAELLSSEARLSGLQIFPNFHFDLQAQSDGKFDIVFVNQERDTLSQPKWLTAVMLLRGLPSLTIYPEFFNLEDRAVNLTSMLRWDAQKRRVLASVSAPFESNPSRRIAAQFDLRSENWDIRNSFTGPAPLLGSLNLRREAAQFDFASYSSGRWNWSAGLELSHRDFRSVIPGSALAPGFLQKGYQLKQLAEIRADLWRLPERRLNLEGTVSSQAARLWSQPSQAFEKLQASALLKWFPQAQGDDFETTQQVRAGKTWGSVPFDELFALGIDPDNDLWMRGHIATRAGRKGSAPLGRNYFLSNSEIDKRIYSNGLLTLKLGPFIDTGKIDDPFPGLGSRRWLCDIGLQAKAKLFGAEAVLSYGKDLRSGNNAIYLIVH